MSDSVVLATNDGNDASGCLRVGAGTSMSCYLGGLLREQRSRFDGGKLELLVAVAYSSDARTLDTGSQYSMEMMKVDRLICAQ